MKRRLCLLAGAAALMGPARAQTKREQRPVYRCGNTLSDRPCSADAEASTVGYDQPSEADRRAAAERARAEQAQADRQQREREAAEQAARRANAPPPRPAPPRATEPTPEPRVRQAGRVRRRKARPSTGT